MSLWIPLIVGTATIAVAELIALNRHRRLLVLDRQRRQFFTRYMRHGDTPQPAATRPVAAGQSAPAEAAVAPPQAPQPVPAHRDKVTVREGIVYVDSHGRCTFANQVARDLLHWTAGELTLSDILAGGDRESTALLGVLAQQGLVEQHPARLAGGAPEPFEISAVALRDRDENMWGAALIIQLPGVPAADSQSAHSPH